MIYYITEEIQKLESNPIMFERTSQIVENK